MLLDQIILSCNEDPTYREFWEPVSWAYKKMFPDVDVHLAYLTNKAEDDPEVVEMRKHGRVTLFKPLPDIPEFGQAKMIRFILAANQGDDICYIDDIDLFPLDANFIDNKVSERINDVLLCVGGEVYYGGNGTLQWNGAYPISQMTAESYIWDYFINPKNLTYPDLLRSWKDVARFDQRENILCPFDPDNDLYFSDERLLKRLLFENPVPKLELQRGYTDYLESTIDRHTFDKSKNYWNYDREKLKRGEYVNAHCVRPFKKYEEHFQPLIQFINDNY